MCGVIVYICIVVFRLSFQSLHESRLRSIAILAVARTICFPAAVYSVTTLTIPSFPGCNFVILPIGHKVGGTLSSLIITSYPSFSCTG